MSTVFYLLGGGGVDRKREEREKPFIASRHTDHAARLFVCRRLFGYRPPLSDYRRCRSLSRVTQTGADAPGLFILAVCRRCRFFLCRKGYRHHRTRGPSSLP